MDDCLFFSEKNKVIEEAVQQSRDAELDINVEEDVAGFLGISLEY